MSHVQLQVKPRRIRAAATSEPPPFRFTAAAAARHRTSRDATSGDRRAVRLPLTSAWLLLRTIGHAIDAVFFLTCITIWCALHLTVWSYAFEMGPAAACFGLSCPGWLRAKVLIACALLGVISFILSRVLSRLRHRATSAVLVLLVTLDLAAVLLLAMRSWL